MNVEFIIWIIRQINVAIHATAGVICIATFMYNFIGIKGTQNHIKAGNLYKIGTIFLLGTSLVSFLIVKTFPFFFMAYMAYYLSYSSSNKIFGNKVNFGIHYSVALFTALFYLSGGKIIGYSEHEYAYMHWGIAFLFFVIWDLIRIFIQRKKTSQIQFRFMHSNRIILSFFFILTAFMVSQFSMKEPKIVYILCFIIPITITTILLMVNNLNIIYKIKIND